MEKVFAKGYWTGHRIFRKTGDPVLEVRNVVPNHPAELILLNYHCCLAQKTQFAVLSTFDVESLPTATGPFLEITHGGYHPH